MSSSSTTAGTLRSDISRTVNAGGITVFEWQQAGHQPYGQSAAPCNQNSKEAQFINLGIKRAIMMLHRDNVTSAIRDVIEYARKDAHFNSHVRTDPGHIVRDFVCHIMTSDLKVGYRYPQSGNCSNLAEVDLSTGIIWFNKRTVETFSSYSIELMNTLEPGKSKTRLNHLFMGIVVPAIHGWSRILASSILRGDFDGMPFVENQVQISKFANEILGHRLYTFSEVEKENTLWLAEAFGDYVIELLFRGEFSIHTNCPDPRGKVSHPAAYSIVDRNFGIKPSSVAQSGIQPSKVEEYRLSGKFVDIICGMAHWPDNTDKYLEPVVGVKKRTLVGELDTIRKKRLRQSSQPQMLTNHLWRQEITRGGSGSGWAYKLFPDYTGPMAP
ncbi:hypothetical protein F5X99DRAFT_413602 [Biscogniauxia marginata]|nr:hypothetical protein F5X99DRAFT_413602 [Biscogniauxia marginata]